MRLHTSASTFLLTPDRGVSGPSLSIQRDGMDFVSVLIDIPSGFDSFGANTGMGTDALHVPSLYVSASQYVAGVAGVIRLLRGLYLCVITKAQVVAKIVGATVYVVQEVKVLPFSTKKETSEVQAAYLEDERMYVEMISKILNSQSLYFSHDYDLTQSAQRIALFSPEMSKLPLWKRADERFFYNWNLVQPLVEKGLDSFILPLISGFVISDLFKIKDTPASFILISRRGWKRTGFRFTCRGLDTEGNAVNYAETEQILILPETSKLKKLRFLSFVQTRGSIPLIWMQTPTLKYTPAIELGDPSLSQRGYVNHFAEQEKIYGRNVIINLINQDGSEGRLEAAFRQQVEKANLLSVRYVAFDFHLECKSMKYENLSRLLAQIADEFTAMNYFFAEYVPIDSDGTKGETGVPTYQVTVLRQQAGAFRTNCMDCLDRTNVVQNVLAEKVLEMQLTALGFVTSADLENCAKAAASAADLTSKKSGGICSKLQFWKKPPKVNPVTLSLLYKVNGVFAWTYKGMWADNADRMSILYSGTGALKTDYTRKGKRTAWGAIDDGVNSVTRYCLNNFYDGANQDALDLFHGRYRPSLQLPPVKTISGNESLPWFVIRVGLVLGVAFIAWSCLAPHSFVPESNFQLLGLFALTQIVVTGLLVVRSGRSFVNKPRFSALAISSLKKM